MILVVRLPPRSPVYAAHNLPRGARIFIGYDARNKPKCGNHAGTALLWRVAWEMRHAQVRLRFDVRVPVEGIKAYERRNGLAQLREFLKLVRLFAAADDFAVGIGHELSAIGMPLPLRDELVIDSGSQ